MNQAIADPEQLRQFAAHLHRFSEEIKNLSSNLSGHMNQLEQTWRDEQQRKFADEFNSQMQQMGRLIKASEEHVSLPASQSRANRRLFGALIPVANSNVRSIESLEAFHAGLTRLSSDWEKSVQEIRMLVQRAASHFSEDRPRYWKQQTQLAERALNEAKDNLAQKRAANSPW